MFKKFSGGGGKGPKKFNREGGDRPMHDAVCGECGNACQVPFRPTGSRPVLCRDCFKKDDAPGYESRSFDKPRFEKRPFKKFDDRGGNGVEQRLKFIKMKLDRILAALESADEDKLF